jgi:hypothetical protein
MFERKNIEKFGIEDQRILKKKAFEVKNIMLSDKNKEANEIQSLRWFHKSYVAIS